MKIKGKNPAIEGVSGKLGRTMLFREVDGQTVICSPPVRTKRILTENQIKQQERFMEAAAYARGQMASPAAKAIYADVAEARGKGKPYQLAFKDYFNAPSVSEVDASNYFGNQGGTIKVRARDDFKVKSVTVSILTASGDLVESGEAVPLDNHLDWIYTSTTANGSVAGWHTVVAKAKDLPGNTTEKQVDVN